jgi:hypothetical protein
VKINFNIEEQNNIIWIRKRTSLTTALIFIAFTSIFFILSAAYLNNYLMLLPIVFFVPLSFFLYNPNNHRKVFTHLIISTISFLIASTSTAIFVPLTIFPLLIDTSGIIAYGLFCLLVLIASSIWEYKKTNQYDNIIINEHFMKSFFWNQRDGNNKSSKYLPAGFAFVGIIAILIKTNGSFSFVESKRLAMFIVGSGAVFGFYVYVGKVVSYTFHFIIRGKSPNEVLYTDYEYYLNEQDVINRNRIANGLEPMDINAFYFDEKKFKQLNNCK